MSKGSKAKVAAFVPTHHLPHDSVPRLRSAAKLFDRFLIFVDQNRATPGTETRAREITPNVHLFRSQSWYDWDLRRIVEACEAEWVFGLDYDEDLSPAWQSESWREFLDEPLFTHYWLPRRWLRGAGTYIAVAPWWPDYQLRLFRTTTPGVEYPQLLHDAIRVPGNGGCLAAFPIHHHVLNMMSLSERREKARQYEHLRPGGALPEYYLPEDSSPKEARLDSALPFNGEQAVAMHPLQPDQIRSIAVHVAKVPRQVRPSEMFWIDAQLNNRTQIHLRGYPPLSVSLAYHWACEKTGRIIVFDGQRTAIFPPAPPNSVSRWEMVVIAPPATGNYSLQVTMVQENVCWLEQICGDIVQAFTVTVAV